MNPYRTVKAGLRSLLRRDIVSRELDEELSHFEDLDTEERMRAGVPAVEARRAARLLVGGTSTRERVVDAGWEAHVQRFWNDIRHGSRSLLRNPAFSTVAVLTLGLGIGANTAMFSIVNAVMLRPLPYREPNHLALLFTSDTRRGLPREDTALPTIMDWKSQHRAFDDVAYFDARRVSVVGPAGDRTVMLRAYVSGNLFAALGVQPELGRTISSQDEAERAPVAVVSNTFWQRDLAAAPDVIGRVVRVDDPSRGAVITLRIIGVMPAEFYFPDKGTQLWVPASTLPSLDQQQGERFARDARQWTAVGRLARGVSVEDARRDLDQLAMRLTAAYPTSDPDFPGFSASVVPMLDYVADARTQTALWLLAGAVGVVLLVACANVANLLLARGTTRQGELALRRALGAGRARLVRQMITEDLLLVSIGAGLGVLLGVGGMALLRPSAARFVPRVEEMAVDWRVLVFAVSIAVLSALIFGLMPALRLSSVNAADTLRGGGRSTQTRRLKRQRNALITLECMLAVCLLAGAGLLLRSLVRLENVDPGFEAHGVVDARLVLPVEARSYMSHAALSAEARLAALDGLVSRLDALPGVESVGFIDDLFVSSARDATITVPGRPGTTGELVQSAVTPGLFETLHVPLRLGRYPQRGDAHSITVNEAFARSYFPKENPIGQSFCVGPFGDRTCFEIAGVVGDMRRQSLEQSAAPQYFVPYVPRMQGRVDMLVRVGESVTGIAAAIRRTAGASIPGVTVASVTTLDEELGDSGARRRFVAELLAIFAGLALALAAIGIFGMVVYAVSERTREIAVRTALGATTANVLRTIVADGMRQPLIGIALGVGVALGATRVLTSMLYGVSATDAATFTAVVILLVLVATLACLAAALKALRINLIEALRE
jgi:putative ABC transport system permease protein